MARIKRGVTTHNRHKKVLKLAKGYFGSKSKLFGPANEQVIKSLSYAYAHRKKRKSDFRKLWIQRINAASRSLGLSYSKFINKLKKSGIIINRKVLSDMAVNNISAFKDLIDYQKNKNK